ncbi:MAG: DUF5668 domain-containing protein [Acidobacteriota bacterium]
MTQPPPLTPPSPAAEAPVALSASPSAAAGAGGETPKQRFWPVILLRLVVGLTLIICGLLFFLETFGFVEVEQLWRLWPLAVVALGVQRLLGEDRKVSGGAALSFIGLWLLVNTLQVAGLTFRSSWPALLVGLGGLVLLRAFTDIGGRAAR